MIEESQPWKWLTATIILFCIYFLGRLKIKHIYHYFDVIGGIYFLSMVYHNMRNLR